MGLANAPEIIELGMHLVSGGYGTTETIKTVPISGTSNLQKLQSILPDALQLCKLRACLFPEDVAMYYATLSFEGKPADSLQILEDNLYGLYQAGAYRFPAPDSIRRAIAFKFVTDDSHASNLTVRGITDDWAGKSAPGFGAGTIGIRTPPTKMPTLGSFTSTPANLIQKYLDGVLFFGGFGKKATGSSPPTPYQFSRYAMASYQGLTTRKWGKPYKFVPGHRRAYS